MVVLKERPPEVPADSTMTVINYYTRGKQMEKTASPEKITRGKCGSANWWQTACGSATAKSNVWSAN